MCGLFAWFVCFVLFGLVWFGFVWGKPLEARWFTPTLGFNRAKALRIAALDS
jgi:hypothetical protein